MTVSDIAKQIRGTKENDYNDGILATTRVGAVRLARTVINGVCNNARVETIKANSDVIDGIKFVGTLDGKTCPHCASYDGHIWRGEDMASARRPPIHPNCRCTLVPYVELKDEEGNVVDIDNERPAANADFDQLAKDAYNQKAKEKGWKRRFEDLSPSTRLKYYYQAQKDYEKETGKPAYRQVDSNLSFPEYFKQQPDSFKRDWLGAKRYEAYKEGKLTEKAIFAPDLSYTISPTSLVKFVEPEVPEELAKLIKEYEKNGKKSDSNADSQTEQNENGQANQTPFERDEQRLIERRERSWNELFPINDLDSDNNKKIEKLFPKKFKGRQKDTQNTRDGAKIGLRFIARFCDNFGIDVDELNAPVFNREIGDRAEYFSSNNSITMSLYNKKEGENSATSDAVHELAHALEYQAKGNLRGLLQDFYESITKRDENGEVIYFLNNDGTIEDDRGQHFRETTILLPDHYASKEYLDNLGNLDGTELLSMYVELMYSTPWIRQDSRYKDFFEGVEKCLKQSRNSK